LFDILQTFVKGYLITFVRLLLGIDAEENSGHLSSVSPTDLFYYLFELKNSTFIQYKNTFT